MPSSYMTVNNVHAPNPKSICYMTSNEAGLCLINVCVSTLSPDEFSQLRIRYQPWPSVFNRLVPRASDSCRPVSYLEGHPSRYQWSKLSYVSADHVCRTSRLGVKNIGFLQCARTKRAEGIRLEFPYCCQSSADSSLAHFSLTFLRHGRPETHRCHHLCHPSRRFGDSSSCCGQTRRQSVIDYAVLYSFCRRRRRRDNALRQRRSKQRSLGTGLRWYSRCCSRIVRCFNTRPPQRTHGHPESRHDCSSYDGSW